MLYRQKNKQPSSVLGERPTVLCGLTSSMEDTSQLTEFVASTVQVSCVVIALLWPFPGRPSPAVCVEEAGDGPGCSGHPISSISCAQRSICNRSRCSYISIHPPDLLDLILKLCWPSASPGDELKPHCCH